MLHAPRFLLAALLGSCSTALLGACAAPPPAREAPAVQTRTWAGDEAYEFMRVAFEAGARRYQDGGWGRLDEQPAVGFTGTHEPPHWLLGLDGGMFWAGGNDDLQGLDDADLDSWEGFAGVMKSWPLISRRLIFEVGAGYALSYAHLDEGTTLLEVDEVWWSGAYARGALLLRLGDDAWAGLAGRSTRGGGGNLGGLGLDGDYDQLAFVLAARW